MAGEILTAGTALGYAVETTEGVRPTTGYTNVPNVRSIPDLNAAPDTVDVTDLSDMTHRRSIPALIDVGGAQAFGFNLTPAVRAAWRALRDAFESARGEGKQVWFAITHTLDEEAYYFSGEPSPLGSSAYEVGEVRGIDAYITLNKIDGWLAKPVNQ